MSGGNKPPNAIVKKKIHSMRIDLLKNCSHATAKSRCVGTQNIGIHAISGTVLYQCLDSSGLYPRMSEGLEVSLKY